MAEGFARTYGSDVLVSRSAGLAPATFISPLTVKMMAEKNIDLREHFPKDLGILSSEKFDVLVNISGNKLPGDMDIPVLEWKVEDPYRRQGVPLSRSVQPARRPGDEADH